MPKTAFGSAVLSVTFVLTALPLTAWSACGDGVVEEPAEQCDDGNVAAGDCCASDCQYEPEETPCGADDVCTAAVAAECDAFGRCSIGLPCPGVGTADLFDSATTGTQQLKMRVRKTQRTAAPDLGDPSAGTQYAACVFNMTSYSYRYELAYEFLFPTGASWRPAGDGFRYKQPDGATSGLRRARVSSRLRDQSSRWVLRHKFVAEGDALALPGPVDATQYFAFENAPPFSTFCLVNDRGMRAGIFSAPGRLNRGFLNSPEHVQWARPLLGD